MMENGTCWFDHEENSRLISHGNETVMNIFSLLSSSLQETLKNQRGKWDDIVCHHIRSVIQLATNGATNTRGKGR